MSTSDAEELLEPLDLTEYERTALEELLILGRTTAPDLAEATGIPKNRMYGVLDRLAEQGFVKVIPGRPKKYQPKPPEEILDRAVENQRQEFEEYRHDIEEVREDFLDQFGPLFEQASEEITPTEELFHVVDVGEPSERETRSLYHEANEAVYVITKSLEYLDSIEPALADALDRGVTVRMLFLNPDHLDDENRRIQTGIVDTLRDEYPSVELRFSESPLPWRGTFVDPSMDYETGKAILLVEENDVPLSMRQAAVTENGSFVAGLSRYFDLVWKHEVLDR
ncbi:TrmB family transcriptional regulator [Halobacterium sp. KA-4]|uniref:TrmB family transcriptional regulator n=1 Tax=Halobacterium sp. KA-4 TaxID=2896367 RepID=UPI001E5BDB09|nr:helix-turn-helix domain-containing protein [Halobacterium sp. KA-4]MCD2200472.1 TrmB family transcriptional regulator [Halobacterium sp. KA-4]